MNKNASITGILIALVCAISSLPFLITQSHRTKVLGALHTIIKMFKREDVYKRRTAADSTENISSTETVATKEEEAKDKEIIKLRQQILQLKTIMHTCYPRTIEAKPALTSITQVINAVPKTSYYCVFQERQKIILQLWLDCDQENRNDEIWLTIANKFKIVELYLYLFDQYMDGKNIAPIIYWKTLDKAMQAYTGVFLNAITEKTDLDIPLKYRKYTYDKQFYIDTNKSDTLSIYRTDKNRKITDISYSEEAPYLIFTKKNLLLFINERNSISLYDMEGNKIYCLAEFTGKLGEWGSVIKVDPNEENIIIALDCIVNHYNIDNLLKEKTHCIYKKFDKRIEFLAMNNDGTLLAMLDEANNLFLFGRNKNQEYYHLAYIALQIWGLEGRKHDSLENSLLFSQDSRLIHWQKSYTTSAAKSIGIVRISQEGEKYTLHSYCIPLLGGICSKNTNETYSTVCAELFIRSYARIGGEISILPYDTNYFFGKVIKSPLRRGLYKGICCNNMRYLLYKECSGNITPYSGHRSYLLNLKTRTMRLLDIAVDDSLFVQKGYSSNIRYDVERQFFSKNNLFVLLKDATSKKYSLFTKYGARLIEFPSVIDQNNNTEVLPFFDTLENRVIHGNKHYFLPEKEQIRSPNIVEYIRELKDMHKTTLDNCIAQKFCDQIANNQQS
jgi:hypothetical protein